MPKQGPACLLGLVLAGLAAVPQTHAQEKIVVAFSRLPPWKFVDEHRFGGAYAEIVRELAAKMKMPIEFIECPLKRCLRFMETGTANLIIGLKDTADRRAYIRFLKTPYRISLAKVFYVPKGKGQSLRQYTDLYQLTIGTKLGAKYFKRFDVDPRLRKVVVRTNPQNFAMLKRGRTDGLIIAEDQGEYWISQLGYRGSFEMAEFFHRDHSPRSIGISRRSKLMDHFDAVEASMRQLVRSGKLREILRVHYFERFGIPMDSPTNVGGKWATDSP